MRINFWVYFPLFISDVRPIYINAIKSAYVGLRKGQRNNEETGENSAGFRAVEKYAFGDIASGLLHAERQDIPGTFGIRLSGTAR